MIAPSRPRPNAAAIRTFERVHQSLEDAKGLISVALTTLSAADKTEWTYERLENMLEDPVYREWKRAARAIFLDHAEVDSIRRIANTEGLTDQARAGIMIALLKGEHSKAQTMALRGREKKDVRREEEQGDSPLARLMLDEE